MVINRQTASAEGIGQVTLARGFVDEIMAQSYRVRSDLMSHPIVGRFVDDRLPIPRPYLAGDTIKLVIIGQDPTVQREASRRTIQTVLNLDRKGSLYSYLNLICTKLGVALDSEVYATNVCKNFYTDPPTRICREQSLDILAASGQAWLPVLKAELAQFPDARIISLGQPILSILVHEIYSRKMTHYWGNPQRWREGYEEPFYAILPDQSTVARRIFPVVHQPSLRGRGNQFYRERIDAYLRFIRQQ